MTGTVATQVKAIAFDRDIERLTEGFTGREWVFKEIERWLQQDNERFFILTGEPGIGKSAIAAKLIQQRQAQQDLAAYHFCIARQISTIEPDNVLFSLAAQLINFFPDYAEALVNTIKPLHLSVDVEINIGTIKDSVVQGVVIENLHTQHPKKSFDIILRQTLSALPNPPEKPILILIDSLDEAVTYSEEDNLVRLFSQVNDLPSWVRLVFTSRLDERRVLSHFKTLKPHHYHLDELSKKSLEDIHTYVDNRVKTASVQGQLQKYKVASTDLVEHYWRYHPTKWDKCDRYGLQYLVAHLVNAAELEEDPIYAEEYTDKVHELLATEVNERHAWFDVKDRIGNTSGFLADIKLAWELAEQNWTEATLPQVIEKQCRYALILSSLNSLSDIPTELLEVLVKAGALYGWTPEQGLAYARQMPNAAKRAQSLAILVDYLPDSQQEALWQEVLTTVQGIQDEYYRAQVLIAVGANFPEAYKEALTAAQNIKIEYRCLEVWANLPQALYKEALTAAQAIQDESMRANVLSVLAANLPQALYKEALTAAQAIQDEFKRADVLSVLAANLPQELYQEVLTAAQAFQEERYRASVLSGMSLT